MTTDQTKRALTLLRSVLGDIESMQTTCPGFEDYFGTFSESFDNGDGANVEWPNLAITGRDIAEFLATLKESAT